MKPLPLAVPICLVAFTSAAQMPLRPGVGDDFASAYCNACHTSDYIVMNSTFLTADQWKAEVAKMRVAFGAPLDDETAAKITAYLASQYAVAAKP
jgi:hypothetical protein